MLWHCIMLLFLQKGWLLTMNEIIRKNFPFLQQNNAEIFLDNAATSQKPKAVLDAMHNFLVHDYAPVHRGIYARSERATAAYEDARNTVARYLNADNAEIIFTKNATEGINFIAATWALDTLRQHDEIVLTELEHHANLVPWQQVAEHTGALLRIIPVNDQGILREDCIDTYITQKTKIVAFVDISNALGTATPKQKLIARARHVGASILLDACQSAPNQRINVKDLDVDFLVFSGHKMLGPTGIGVLYIAKKIQPYVRPYQFGGGMIFDADYYKASWLSAPHCYEAGTPPITEAIGLAAAIRYLTNSVDLALVRNHQASLCRRLIEGLDKNSQITILGSPEYLVEHGHLVSFVHKKYHHHDVAAFLDKHGIAVRAGSYCAQPLAKRLGIDGSVRVSFYLYNTHDEVDTLLHLLDRLK